jgi:tetratricopeptide (TPR) repeat protein
MSRLPPAFAKHRNSANQRRSQPQPQSGVDEAVRRAWLCFNSGDFAQAEKLCFAVLARDVANVPALMLAGSLARHTSDFGQAVTFFKKVVALRPDLLEARLGLAAACIDARDHEDAIRHLRHVLARRPDMVTALGALGKCYTALGKPELALPFFEKATKLQPTHPDLRRDHAEALIALGRMDEAADLLRESIARGYHVAPSYQSLVETRTMSGEPVELAQIVEALSASNQAPHDRMILHHAAGKIMNDLGRHEEAVEHFQAGKAAGGYSFDLEALRRRFDMRIAAFTPELLSSKSAFANPSEVPVFIVGMPRSGTTLTEQICASHPAVHGAGELDKLGDILREEGYAFAPNGNLPKQPQALTADEAQSLSTAYLDFVRRTSPSSARIVDKMPHNFQLVGMIALLFPNARIIHCTRDPIDNCLSCFFTPFNKRHSYNTDLRTLGLYYREYRRLMRHWETLLPGRIHECNYETMIADQEAESRRLIDFLGQPWDDACLRFYETDRSVTTPSRWQVRQPIYATSVKRWKKYENKIQPLIEALGDLADV